MHSRKTVIADEIRASIEAGDLRPGDMLPSLEDMREYHRAAVGTIRAAYALLESEHLVFTVQGLGTVVRVPGMMPANAENVADLLRGRIASGALRPGDMLPSHTQMTKLFGISDKSAESVMRQLQDEGLVTRRNGVGNIVVDPTEPTSRRSDNAA